MASSTLGALGEFGSIGRVRALLARHGVAEAPGLVQGIGDDAAVWQDGATTWVATTDLLLEGVHFDTRWSSWEDVGWKAMAMNLSDVAAMGAAPRFALVSVAFGPSTPTAALEGLYQGMALLAGRFGMAIVGGDTVRSPGPAVINVALLGTTDRPPLLRSAARSGDVVLVTGALGAAAGGVELLAAERPDLQPSLVQAHRRPLPRVSEGRAAAGAGVRVAMDVSDGLVADLGKLCAASRVAAEVWAERVPLAPGLREALPERALALALTGGDDYELLLACPPRQAAALRAGWPAHLAPLTEIGRLLPWPGGAVGPAGEGLVRVVDGTGAAVAVGAAGYDAFR